MITLFPNATLTYVFRSVAQSIEVFTKVKSNDKNYISWSLSVKMILEGCHKFDFLIGEIP